MEQLTQTIDLSFELRDPFLQRVDLFLVRRPGERIVADGAELFEPALIRVLGSIAHSPTLVAPGWPGQAELVAQHVIDCGFVED